MRFGLGLDLELIGLRPLKGLSHRLRQERQMR